MAAFGSLQRVREDASAVRRRHRAQSGARSGAARLQAPECRRCRTRSRTSTTSNTARSASIRATRCGAARGCDFTAEFFHRGFLYKERGRDLRSRRRPARAPIRYSPDLFTFDKVKPPTGDIGFAGFRMHYPLNRPDYYDEVCAFLGASYFRAVAKGQGYGLSARGLAIKTADPTGEEFPRVHAPSGSSGRAKGSDAIVVHALLDSQSAAGAFRFTIRPGAADGVRHRDGAVSARRHRARSASRR